MKKALFTTLIGLLIGFSSQAQYESSIGLRLGGWENGLTFKHFLGEGSAVEGIFSTRWRGYNITGLYEVQNQIPDVEGLYWYIGGGGHIGFFDDRYYRGWGTTGKTYTVIGVDGIIGLEYVFEDVPINVSADWKPAVNLVGFSSFWPDNGALSVRYIF